MDELTVLQMQKGIPGRGYCMLQRPQERKRGLWNSEVVRGIGVQISKGAWQTRPEKKVNKIVKSFLCHAKKLSLFYCQ